jgi:N utilization substance protein A
MFITRALSPAKYLQLNKRRTKRADVYLKEVSKAIGRGGHNIRLAVF